MGMSLGITTPLNFSPISSDSSNRKIHTGKFWVSGQDDIDLLSFFNFIDPFSFFIVEIVCSIGWYICYDTFCFLLTCFFAYQPQDRKCQGFCASYFSYSIAMWANFIGRIIQRRPQSLSGHF